MKNLSHFGSLLCGLPNCFRKSDAQSNAGGVAGQEGVELHNLAPAPAAPAPAANTAARTARLPRAAGGIGTAYTLTNEYLNQITKEDADRKDPNGQTWLHRAAIGGKLNWVKSLAGKADPNIPDNAGQTALHHASKVDDRIVRSMLGDGADVNIKDMYGATPLHHATAARDEIVTPIIRELMKAGSDPTVPDNAGDTALHRIARRGNADALKIMLEGAANANKLVRENNLDRDLLGIAQATGNGEVAKLVREAPWTIAPETVKKRVVAARITIRYRARKLGDQLRQHISVNSIGDGIHYGRMFSGFHLYQDIGIQGAATAGPPVRLEFLSFPADKYDWKIVGGDRLCNPLKMDKEELSDLSSLKFPLESPIAFATLSFYNQYGMYPDFPDHAPIGKTVISGREIKSVEVPKDYAAEYFELADSHGSIATAGPVLCKDGIAQFPESKLDDPKFQYETSVERAFSGGQPQLPGEMFHASHPNPRTAICFPGKANDAQKNGSYMEDRIRIILSTNMTQVRGLCSPGWTMPGFSNAATRFTRMNAHPDGFALNLDGGAAVKGAVIGRNREAQVSIEEEEHSSSPVYLMISKKDSA